MRTDEEKVLYAVYKKREKITDKIQQMNDNVLIGAVDYSKTKVQISHTESTVERQAEKNLKLYEEVQVLQAEIDKIVKVIDALPDMMERFLLEEFTYHGTWKTSMDVYGNPRNFKKAKQTALKHFGKILQNTIQKGVSE